MTTAFDRYPLKTKTPCCQRAMAFPLETLGAREYTRLCPKCKTGYIITIRTTQKSKGVYVSVVDWETGLARHQNTVNTP